MKYASGRKLGKCKQKSSQVEVGGFSRLRLLKVSIVISCPRWFIQPWPNLIPKRLGWSQQRWTPSNLKVQLDQNENVRPLKTERGRKIRKKVGTFWGVPVSHQTFWMPGIWFFRMASIVFTKKNFPKIHIFGGQAASWRWWNTIHLFDAMWALGNGYFYGIVRWAYPVQQQNCHRLKLLNGAFIVGGRQDGLATYFLSTKASKTKNARACDYSKTSDEFMITSCYRQRAKSVMLSEAFSLSLPKSWSITHFEWKQNLTKSITPQWNNSPKWISEEYDCSS